MSCSYSSFYQLQIPQTIIVLSKLSYFTFSERDIICQTSARCKDLNLSQAAQQESRDPSYSAFMSMTQRASSALKCTLYADDTVLYVHGTKARICCHVICIYSTDSTVCSDNVLLYILFTHNKLFKTRQVSLKET